MLTQHTLTRLRSLKLDGMARAFDEQLAQPASHALSFEERFALLVDREVAWRDTRRLERLLKQARLKFPGACLEDLDTRALRGLDQRLVATLGSCDWVRAGQSVIATGETGLGKSWIACALGHQAARQGFSVLYTRFTRLVEELRIAHGDGSFGRRLAQLAKTDVLIVDDFALAPIGPAERADLLEVLDDRTPGKSTIMTSQLPVDHWHEYLAEPTIADAILDRVVHHSHRIALRGESLRKNKPEKGPTKS
ncbi:MAG TPA: IS21-like element helper ATPase IstB [Burkholderiaceae bacterium]|nr:IS21-like element helper ATPase IstB [Burkholderiaceae bacterium]